MRIRVLASVVASFVLLPAAASAAVLYARPDGTSNMVCGQADPCDVVTAVNNAHSGDTVILEPGTYTPTMTVDDGGTGGPITIEGEPGARLPEIDSSASYAIEILNGSTVSHLAVVNHENNAWGIYVSGTPASLDRVYVQVDGSGSTACYPYGTLTDSVCWANGSNDVGMTLLVSDFASATLRNDTIVGAGTGSDGVVVNPQSSSQTMTVDMTNTIARGAAADILVGAVSGATATVTADHSNFANVVQGSVGGMITPPIAGSPTNQTAAPCSSSPAPATSTSSPARRRAVPGIDSPLNGTTDFDGNPREVEGKTDIGAVEFVPPPTCTPRRVSDRFDKSAAAALHCVDLVGAAVTYAIVRQPGHGTLSSVNAGGTVLYTPDRGYSGPDSFTYDGKSTHGTSAATTVTITVGPPPPRISHVKLKRSTVNFTLSAAASVTLTFVRHGHKNVTAKLKGRAGKNSYKVKKLKAGKYKLTISASNAGGRSKPAKLSFKIA